MSKCCLFAEFRRYDAFPLSLYRHDDVSDELYTEVLLLVKAHYIKNLFISTFIVLIPSIKCSKTPLPIQV